MKVALGTVEVDEFQRLAIADFFGLEGPAPHAVVKAYLRHEGLGGLEELTDAISEEPEGPMSLACRCEQCGGEPDWHVMRRGDAVVTWACSYDLSNVLSRLARRGEVTECVVSRSAAHVLTEARAALFPKEPEAR